MKSRTPATILWLILTNLMLALSVCVCAYSTFIFFNPQSALNLLPPPTRTPRPFPTVPQAVSTPKDAPTATAEATATPEAGATMTETLPTAINTSTATPTPLGASPTVNITENATTAPLTDTPIPLPVTSTPEGGYPGGNPTNGAPPTGYP